MGGASEELSSIDAEIQALMAKKQRVLEQEQRQAAREAKEKSKILVATTPTKKGQLNSA